MPICSRNDRWLRSQQAMSGTYHSYPPLIDSIDRVPRELDKQSNGLQPFNNDGLHFHIVRSGLSLRQYKTLPWREYTAESAVLSFGHSHITSESSLFLGRCVENMVVIQSQ